MGRLSGAWTTISSRRGLREGWAEEKRCWDLDRRAQTEVCATENRRTQAEACATEGEERSLGSRWSLGTDISGRAGVQIPDLIGCLVNRKTPHPRVFL